MSGHHNPHGVGGDFLPLTSCGSVCWECTAPSGPTWRWEILIYSLPSVPRFDDRITGKLDEFAPSAKIIHIDIDPTSISKNVKVDIPIVGDCKDALSKLLKLAKEKPIEELKKVRKPWLDQIQKWKETYPLAYEQKDDVIKPQYVVEKIYELSPG